MNRTIAIGVWNLLVLFLVTTLWSTEVATLKELWGSAQALVGGFGMGARSASHPPLWFLVSGVGMTAVVCTLPGFAFVLAKSKTTEVVDYWRLHQQATKIIADEQDMITASDASCTARNIAMHFDDATVLNSDAALIVVEALQAYENAVQARIEQAAARMHGSRAITNKERHACEAALQQGEAALKRASSLTV